MDFILTLFLLFIGAGWLVSKLFNKLVFPPENEKETNIIINNYTTEQHLHISKEDLKGLKK